MQELEVYSCGLKFAANYKGFVLSFGTDLWQILVKFLVFPGTGKQLPNTEFLLLSKLY